jgi:hypothetical protein
LLFFRQWLSTTGKSNFLGIGFYQTWGSTVETSFWAWTLISIQNWQLLISIKISQLSRFFFWKCQEILDCQDKLLGLYLNIDTKLRSLDLDGDFSTVQTYFLKMSRISQLSRQTFWQCLDRESGWRHYQNKSRP